MSLNPNWLWVGEPFPRVQDMGVAWKGHSGWDGGRPLKSRRPKLPRSVAQSQKVFEP